MIMRKILLTLAVLLLAASAAHRAAADGVDDILAGFASSKYDEIEKTIGALAASGDASAPAILDALNAGALQIAAD
jgi:urea transport system permease protein